MLTLQDAWNWCQEHYAQITCMDSNISVEIPEFDTVIAETLQEAVQLAKELEENSGKLSEYKALAALARAENRYEDAKNWEGLAEAEEKRLQAEIPNPNWLPSDAELDAAEAELAVRELEEAQQAYRQMAEDETRVIKAELTNGAYFL